MFLWFTHWVKLLLFSDKNWILAPFYLSRGCLSQIELNWSKYFQLLLGLCFKMFFRFTYWVKQLLLSGLNWIIATLYLARSCLGYMGLDLAKIGPISIRTKFRNIFGVYLLSLATFVFWSELNSSSFILVKLGLHGLLDKFELRLIQPLLSLRLGAELANIQPLNNLLKEASIQVNVNL